MLPELDFRSSESWIVVGPWIVGATFLWSGAIKAVAPHVFSAHLTKLDWIPRRLNSHAVVAVAALESAWGIALILGVAWGFVLPATVAVLAILTGISWWSVETGRTTDCGCYGGYVVPSTAQSIALNAGLAALVLGAWFALPHSLDAPTWKVAVTAITCLVFGTLATLSQRFLAKHGRFMFDLSPLKVGRRWNSGWGASPNGEEKELLVSYLGPDCPHCKNWVRVLNAMQQAPGLPRVAGVVATSREKVERFVEGSGVRFPITTIPQTLMNRLAWSVPTTVLVSDGRIQNQWSGSMPPEFYHRFKRAFFTSSEQNSATTPVQGKIA
ncbi:MAG: MauE/DoxX family redox-associated membrane protein [Gemmatimonadaceae bacterium]